MLRKASILFVLGAMAACSSPPKSNTQDAGADSATGDYPPGPYGTNVGDVAENATFKGRKGGMSSPRETVTLGTFHAMRKEGKKFLVLNVAAFWCSPCKEEAKEFQSAIVPTYSPKGVAFLSVVLETSARTPATDEDVDLWIKTYNLTFPVVSDPDGYVNLFFDKNQMPLNMILNLETMKIEKKIIGADLARVKADIDKLLGG